jgi:thiamine biosynthesis lipoprotein
MNIVEFELISPAGKWIVVIANLMQVSFMVLALVYMPVDSFARSEHLIQGRTMGTTYRVSVVAASDLRIDVLKDKIGKRLVEINASMSTYQKDSEISRFNRLQQAQQPIPISNDFHRVLTTAQAIYELSNGAWDGTVNPLVDLWGFGRAGRRRDLPSEKEIKNLLPDIGFDNVLIGPDRTLAKRRGSITLDLSSIAKGYGVDQVAEVVQRAGIDDFLVEIGGEIYASGRRPDGKLWRIGINRPRTDAGVADVYKIVDLDHQAFATSGDYRNFFEVDGIRYSHVIDPRTGYPVANGIVSVSIVAENCTLADGLATAVMAMKLDKGLDLINRLVDVEGLIIIEKSDGSLQSLVSKNFKVQQ